MNTGKFDRHSRFRYQNSEAYEEYSRLPNMFHADIVWSARQRIQRQHQANKSRPKAAHDTSGRW